MDFSVLWQFAGGQLLFKKAWFYLGYNTDVLQHDFLSDNFNHMNWSTVYSPSEAKTHFMKYFLPPKAATLPYPSLVNQLTTILLLLMQFKLSEVSWDSTTYRWIFLLREYPRLWMTSSNFLLLVRFRYFLQYFICFWLCPTQSHLLETWTIYIRFLSELPFWQPCLHFLPTFLFFHLVGTVNVASTVFSNHTCEDTQKVLGKLN